MTFRRLSALKECRIAPGPIFVVKVVLCIDSR